MVVINGKVYSGNVTIVNGRVVGGDSNDSSSDKKVDERKCERSEGIRRIGIRSNVPVKVSAEKCKNVEAHLHGTFVGDGNPNLSVTRSENKILIVAEVDDNGNNISIFSSNSVIINNCGNTGGLNLDVILPEEMFEEIFLESKNGNVNVTNSVNANEIRVDCKNGKVNVSATFKQLTIDCKNGSIDVISEAQSDVRLDITSKNGTVNVSVGNIGTSNVPDCH